MTVRDRVMNNTKTPAPKITASKHINSRLREHTRNDEIPKVDKLGASVSNPSVQILMNKKIKQCYWSPVKSGTVNEGLPSRNYISGGFSDF